MSIQLQDKLPKSSRSMPIPHPSRGSVCPFAWCSFFRLQQHPAKLLTPPTICANTQFLARQMACSLTSTRSGRTRCSLSTTTESVTTVVTIAASAVDAEIINMIIICNFDACSTEEPPRIAPVIIPGIEMIPMTLYTHKALWCRAIGE